MNISVVIPNYNGRDLLERNLPKILEAVFPYKEGQVDIIVTDDASQDDSLSFLHKYAQELATTNILLKTVKNPYSYNLGFSSNVNRGVSSAKGDIIILLNSDVSPHKDFLKPLIKHFENPVLFAVGCMDESIEEGEIVLRGRGVGKWQRGFLVHRAGNINKTNTLWVSCGSGAFRKNMWERLEGLNELYSPFYWEDVDLSYRAIKSGYEIIFEPKSRVIHEHTKGAIQKNYSSYNKTKIVFRNQFTFIWVNITDLDLLFSHLCWLPYHILKALMRRDKAFFWGFFHALGRLPQITSYKSHAKKMFVMTDKKVIAKNNE